MVPVLIVLGITGISLALYFFIGRPDLLTSVIPERSIEDQETETDKFIRAVEELEARMRQEPDNVEGWATLGAGYSSLGRFSDATIAYLRASRLDPENPDFHAAIGKAVTLANDGRVTEDAKAAFETALIFDPGNFIALYYLGVAALQAGDRATARTTWERLLILFPPGSDEVLFIKERLKQLDCGSQ